MSTYDSLDAYNADQRAAAGFCETGDGRRRDGKHRKCWACGHKGQR